MPLLSMMSVTSQSIFHSSSDLYFQVIPLESFRAQSWNGSFVSVVAGGDGIPLTFANRHQYVERALHFRLHEMDRQVSILLL